MTSADVSLTEAGQVLGTAGYMSPEQVRGIGVDHRSDLFVFGAILFEMLSGQRAFRRDTAAETMTAILKEDPPELTEREPQHFSGAGSDCASLPGEESGPALSDGSRSGVRSGSGISVLWLVGRVGGHNPLPVQRVRRLQPLIIVLLLAVAAGLGYWLGHRAKPASEVTYHQLTFRKGAVLSARFAPDNRTVIYSAAWGGLAPGTFFHAGREHRVASPGIESSGSAGHFLARRNCRFFEARSAGRILRHAGNAGPYALDWGNGSPRDSGEC